MSRHLNSITNTVLAFPVILFAVILAAAGEAGEEPAQKPQPSFGGATGWLNTQPVALADLRGKVVLIDFWTYTCVNWRRTLPYIREWASKYKAQGLIVIGVHTPEFPFEHKLENIKRAVREMNIGYPVVADNNFEIWNSFQNEYWPALYLVDAKGQIRYQKFGEGDYRESELKIQQLLKEVSPENIFSQTVALQPKGFEAAADWENLKSPENYVGYGRTRGFASPGGMTADKRVFYTLPGQLSLNQWGVSGEWVTGNEFLLLNRGSGRITYRFHARDLNLIMAPAVPGASIKFRLLIDGRPPGNAHGLDADGNGNGVVSEPRMYQLIRQQGPVVDRQFQIEFIDLQVEVFDFTFG